MSDVTDRLAEASKHAADLTTDFVTVHMSIETGGIRVGVYYDVDGRAADAGKLVNYADIEGAEINPLVLGIDAALAFVGVA